MSWVPYPAVSSGITPTRQNQVAHSHYDGPSGALELVVYLVILIIPNAVALSIHFEPR